VLPIVSDNYEEAPEQAKEDSVKSSLATKGRSKVTVKEEEEYQSK
jgi:hypothetical protein